jgi:hypothetical protein
MAAYVGMITCLSIDAPGCKDGLSPTNVVYQNWWPSRSTKATRRDLMVNKILLSRHARAKVANPTESWPNLNESEERARVKGIAPLPSQVRYLSTSRRGINPHSSCDWISNDIKEVDLLGQNWGVQRLGNSSSGSFEAVAIQGRSASRGHS